MDRPLRKSSKIRVVAVLGVVSLIVAVSARSALTASGGPQSGEQRNMMRVGHVDLQGRAAYQPNTIVYPDGRTIAFVGTHTGSALNPLTGQVEPNGTMIVDVTDPRNPVETAHIPVAGGQSQMVRMCLGSALPGGQPGRVYLMRNIQGGGALAGYETWDVTDVRAPVFLAAIRNLRSTHKHWWECTTGIAYMPGSLNATWGFPLWRQSQAMVIVDWSNPHVEPTYLMTYGLPGGEPGGDPAIPASEFPSLHGPISTFEHPDAGELLVRGTAPDGLIGNRLYLAYGVGANGVLQILDRRKLLPPSHGGTYAGDPNTPTVDDLLSAQVGRLNMSPDQGGHTSFPVFGLAPTSYQDFNPGAAVAYTTRRDIVLLASESTSNRCNEGPHWSFVVDVNTENRPFNLATMWVDPRAGEKYPRGNYCTRGARFGVHSGEENFRNPLYGKLTVLAYFTGGVRVWDIREPQAPVEVAFYVPVSNQNTNPNTGYMTNNVEVDDRGYIYAADRTGAGLDILQLTGPARHIVFPPGQ